MTQVTIDNLLAAGYTKYPGQFEHPIYQKRVEDAHGIRYHLTFTHHVLNRIGAMFGVSEQFTRDGMTFNVEFLPHDETIEQIEAFYADTWIRLQADYYQVRQDRHVPHVPQRDIMAIDYGSMTLEELEAALSRLRQEGDRLAISAHQIMDRLDAQATIAAAKAGKKALSRP